MQESEKYEEWKLNRPADRILEIGTSYIFCFVLFSFLCRYVINMASLSVLQFFESYKRPMLIIYSTDVPMSSGVYNIRSKGSLLNSYEFEWDPQKETKLYVIVSTDWKHFSFCLM